MSEECPICKEALECLAGDEFVECAICGTKSAQRLGCQPSFSHHRPSDRMEA